MQKEALQKAVGDALADFRYRAACYDAMKSRGIKDPEGFMREVKSALTTAHMCVEDLGNDRGGWAWEEVVSEIDALLTQMEGK